VVLPTPGLPVTSTFFTRIATPRARLVLGFAG